MSNSCILLIDRTLSGATTLGQSWPGIHGKDEVLHIPQRSSITGALPIDCLMSYPEHSLGWSGIDGNELVLHIPQNSSIAGALTSFCFLSY